MAADRTKVLKQTQILTARGQYDAAIAELKKLAMDTPNDGSIHNSIGDLHLKRNATSEAASAFLQAGAAFRAEGATLKAIAAFKKVLKSNPTRYEVYRYLGDLNVERGLMSTAVQDYLTLGKHYLKERRGKDALEIYKKIVSHDPSNLHAQQRVAELCIQENQQGEATNVYLQLGRDHSAQGRYDEAKDAYLAVLRIDPNNSEASQFVESMKNGSAGSIKAVKSEAGATQQKMSEPFDLLGEATRRIEEKQYAGAEAILNQLLTKEPGNPQVCQLLARLHLQRGDFNVALGEYRFLAGAALRAQDVMLAESLIVEFLSVKPDTVPLLELYGELLEGKGNGAGAAEQYAKAIELLLQHPEPGMESLHEELFEKVRMLSTDVELVSRLATKIQAESVDDDVTSSACAAEADTPPSTSEQDWHFSLEGAEPDNINAFVKTSNSEEDRLSSTSVHTNYEGKYATTLKPQETTADQTQLCEDPNESVECATLPENTQQTESDEPHAPCPTHDEADQPIPALTQSENAQQTESDGPHAPCPTHDEADQPIPALTQKPTEPTPDYEAHFTLGVAYKRMGLYPDAREEFEVSKTGDAFYIDSCLMAALCYKEEHLLPQAIQGLEEVVSDPRCRDAKGQAIRYELALLYEAEAQWGKAADTYQSIHSFHDVPRRLETLRRKGPAGQDTLPLAG